MGKSSTYVRGSTAQLAGVSAGAGNKTHVNIPISKASKLTQGELAAARIKAYKESLRRRKVILEAGSRRPGTITFDSTHWRVLPSKRTYCQPSSSVKNRVKRNESTLPNSGEVGSYICRTPLDFVEQANAQRETDYRVFIEGVEITAYVRGAMNWGLQGTGGTNSCSFDLNNTQDAFIITPVNICANLNTSGWRIDKSDLKKDPIIHNEPRYDELAKYLIYRKKFLRVNPGSKSAEIDSETGMWLYRLDPYSCIIAKHDCIRVFRRLGHISGTGVKFKTKNVYYDLWIPAFTGFVRSAIWKDNYIDGDRVVSVDCFDYRGLMEQMRVRTTGLPLGGVGSGSTTAVRKRKKTETDKLLDKSTGVSGGGTIIIKDNRIRAVATQQGFMSILDELYDYRVKIGQAKCLKVDQTGKSEDYNKCFTKDLGGVPRYMKKAIDTLKTLENEFIKNTDVLEKIAGVKAWLEKDTLNYKEKVKKTLAQKRIAEQARLDAVAAAATGGPPQNASATTIKIVKKDKSGKILYGNVTKKQLAQLIKDKVVVLNKKTRQYEYKAAVKVNTSFDISWLKYSTQGITSTTAEDIGAINIKLPGTEGKSSSDDNLLFALINYLQTAPLERGTEVKFPKEKDRVTLAGLVDVSVMKQIAQVCSSSTNVFITTIAVLRPEARTNEAALKKWRNKNIGGLVGYLKHTIIPKLKSTRGKLEEKLRPQLKALYDAIKKEIESSKKELFNTKAAKSMGKEKFLRKLGSIEVEWRKKRNQGKKKLTGRTDTARNYAELIQVEPTFEAKQAGLFADLVKSINQNLHPLAGMSYEESVTWLCCSQSQVVPGVLMEIDSYQKAQARGQLENWNRVMLFGTFGRPLSYDEVTAVGALSDSNLKSIYSPLVIFMHLMLPSSGTGARTIVQQEITKNTGNIPTFSFKSRKDLIDEISELLKYQWYVTPFGDIAFEFPHYNAMPAYWGKTFRGAYVLEKEITGMSVNEDGGNVPSAWVITGMEEDPAKRVAGSEATENLLYKIAIVAPILVRRHGVKVEHVNIAIPGVGAQVDNHGASGATSLIAWGLLHIQQQLGESYQITVDPFPERPYLLPNRPMWIIPRHKLCLLKTVNYTFDSPNGPATVSVESGFSRWLFRDGTFRTVGGGKDPVINYAGIFTGEINYRTKEGVSTGATTYKKGRQFTNAACAPALGQKHQLASAFYGDQISQTTQGWRYAPAGTVGTTTKDASGNVQTNETVLPPNATSPTNPSLGHKASKQGLNPGEKKASTVNAARSGLRIQDRKASKELEVYNISKLFYDPYPYGESYLKRSDRYATRGMGAGSIGGRFNTWGILRKQLSGGAGSYVSGFKNKKKRRGNIEVPWHAGIDIMVPRGTPIKAPVNLRAMQVWFSLGGSGGNRSKVLGRRLWKRITIEVTKNEYGIEIDRKRHENIVAGDDFMFFVRRNVNGKPIEYAVKEGETSVLVYVDYYKEMYRKYLAMKEDGVKVNNLNVRATARHNARNGLLLTAMGRVQIPNSKGTKYDGQSVKASFNFVHNEAIAKKNNLMFGINLQKAQADPDDPEKSDTIAYVGSSGGYSDPHCHFELYIYPGDKSIEKDIFEEVRKANNEYLTTQLQLKFSGGSSKSNALSPHWKRYFSARKSYKGIKTVDDAINYWVRHSRILTSLINPPKGRRIATNPLFFFKPEQIVPYAARYAKSVETEATRLKNEGKLYSSQAHYERSGKLTSGAICQEATDADSKRLKTKYTQCVLKAKKETGVSNYRTLSKKLRTCAETLKKENKTLAKKLKRMKEQRAENESYKLLEKLNMA